MAQMWWDPDAERTAARTSRIMRMSAVRRLWPMLPAMMLGGCAGVQSAFSPFGVEAAATARLTLVMAAAGVVIAIAVALLVVKAVRAPEGALSHAGGMRLILWLGAIGPTVLLFALLLWSLPMMRQLPVAPNDLTIAVGGEQFWWRVRYQPVGAAAVEDANLVRVPVGRTVRILLTSPDVIHSFWVPGLAGKVDMIPGRTNTLAVRATKAGTYRGQCTEFCGLAHAKMAFDVVAMEAGAFDAWLAGADRGGGPASQRAADVAYPGGYGDVGAVSPVSSPAQAGALVQAVRPDPGLRRGATARAGAGAALYASYGCQGCHAIRGEGGRIGPDLTLLPERRSLAAASLPLTPAALAGFVKDPVATKAGVLMPSFPAMTQAESAAIAAYLLEPK